MGNILNIINSDKHFYELDKYVYMKMFRREHFYSSEIKPYFKINIDFQDINKNDKLFI